MICKEMSSHSFAKFVIKYSFDRGSNIFCFTLAKTRAQQTCKKTIRIWPYVLVTMQKAVLRSDTASQQRCCCKVVKKLSSYGPVVY